MPIIQIATPFNIDIEFEIAEFHKRILAYLVDFLLIFFYVVSMLYLLFGALNIGEGGIGFVLLVILLPVLFYMLASEVLMGGQTVGKRIMHIKVVSLDGAEPTLGQYLLRWFLRFYEWGFIISSFFQGNIFWGIGVLMLGGFTAVIIMAASGKSQRLGDMAAGTVVVNTRSALTVHDTIFQYVKTDYQVSFPEVMRLSDRDINTVKNVIEQSKKSNQYDMVNRVAGKVQEVLGISSNMYALDFLEKLMEDYNYLATKE
ncbi:MAG: hypothetical protein RL172_61 [Bacteroidota bacterium]